MGSWMLRCAVAGIGTCKTAKYNNSRFSALEVSAKVHASLCFREQVFETHQNRRRKPQRPLRRFLSGGDLYGDATTLLERIGNNVELLAIHPDVVGAAITQVFNPGTVFSGGLVYGRTHDSAYF